MPVKKSHALEQGSLRNIWEWFLKPLLVVKPPQWTMDEFFQHTVFHTHERTVICFEVTTPFKMPGLLYVAGAVKVQGIGFREIKKGTKLWVREDTTLPHVDVEMVEPKEQVFCLSKDEWHSLRFRVAEVSAGKR